MERTIKCLEGNPNFWDDPPVCISEYKSNSCNNFLTKMIGITFKFSSEEGLNFFPTFWRNICSELQQIQKFCCIQKRYFWKVLQLKFWTSSFQNHFKNTHFYRCQRGQKIQWMGRLGRMFSDMWRRNTQAIPNMHWPIFRWIYMCRWC